MRSQFGSVLLLHFETCARLSDTVHICLISDLTREYACLGSSSRIVVKAFQCVRPIAKDTPTGKPANPQRRGGGDHLSVHPGEETPWARGTVVSRCSGLRPASGAARRNCFPAARSPRVPGPSWAGRAEHGPFGVAASPHQGGAAPACQRPGSEWKRREAR